MHWQSKVFHDQFVASKENPADAGLLLGRLSHPCDQRSWTDVRVSFKVLKAQMATD